MIGIHLIIIIILYHYITYYILLSISSISYVYSSQPLPLHLLHPLYEIRIINVILQRISYRVVNTQDLPIWILLLSSLQVYRTSKLSI